MNAEFILLTEEGKPYPVMSGGEMRRLKKKLEQLGRTVAVYRLHTNTRGEKVL